MQAIKKLLSKTTYALIVVVFLMFGSGLLGILIGILIAPTSQGNSPNQAITQVAITQISVIKEELAVTQVVAGPTYTPYPTYTSQPRPEPITIMVTATLPPGFTPVFNFTGEGKGTTDLFSLETGIIRVRWEYQGESNFAFYLRRLDNDSRELIENTIGSTTGQAIMNIGKSDEYLFDIDMARGTWTIMVDYKP